MPLATRARAAAILAAVAALATVAAAPSAAAADPPRYRLGATGQIFLTTDTKLDLSFERTRFAATTGDDTEDVTTFEGQVAVDYVIGRRVTLGGLIGFSATSVVVESPGQNEKDKSNGFVFGGRVGYLVGLGCDTALWPRVGLVAGKPTVATRRGSLTGQVAALELSAPLLWRPVSRIVLGLAPTFSTDVYSDYGPEVEAPHRRSFAIHGLIGVWFHGY